jgi:ribonuclease VapC
MIVDSSAILAILFNEGDAESFARAMTDADACRISAANFVEVAIVVEAQTKATGSRQFDAFFRRAGIIVEPVTEEQAHIARQAYSDFGKGATKPGSTSATVSPMRSPRQRVRPLLCKGEDFKKTDIASAT